MVQRVKIWLEKLRFDPRSRLPRSAPTPEFIAKVHKIVMEDRRLKVREIAEAVGMSSEQVFHILTEELGMKKISSRYWTINAPEWKCPSKV